MFHDDKIWKSALVLEDHVIQTSGLVSVIYSWGRRDRIKHVVLASSKL
jgi:hypothetical protein